MQIVRYVMWFQVVGQRPETTWAGFVVVRCVAKKSRNVFLCASECVLPSSTPGTAAACLSHTNLYCSWKYNRWKRLFMTAHDGERGRPVFCVWVCVINPQWDLSCCVSLSVCVCFCIAGWLVLRPHCPGSACSVRELECACGRRVAPLWPVPTASSLWNAWHSRCLPNELLKKTC